MSDSKGTPADVAAKVNSPDGVNENPPAGNPEPAQEPDWKAEAAKAREAGDDLAAWKAEARKWEAQAKANSAAAARLAEIEEANKTEAEKQAEALAAAQARLAEYEKREQVAAWKAEVSKETGVPAAALAGDSLEAIQAHAEVLAPLITKQTEEQTQERRSVPALGKQPARSGNVPLDDQIAAAEKAGDKTLVASLKAMKLGSVTT